MINWEFIKAELLNDTSVEELAQLAGTTYKNMWNRIRRHEVKDGVIYMKENQLRSKNNSKKAPAPKFCPVTRAPRQPEECKECFNEDCKGKEAPEEKQVFFPKEACIHMEACNSYGTGKCTAACKNYQPEEKPVFLTKKLNIPPECPEDNPRDLLPVVKAEAVPIQQPEANPETVPELITVTKEVYETIKYKLDCCEISISEAREAIRQEEKRRDAWAAILARLIIEDNPEGVT